MASSIGQLLSYLIKNNLYKSNTEDYYVRACYDGYMYFKEQNDWFFRKSLNEFIRIPKNIVNVAAFDHAPIEAKKGLCVGVNNDK